ncbi:hypothetical protein LTR17_019445 [Elasticomyces elasticus]|nr:hypothetical protein LTR17_019445 [Elasticomyces elasticus]
MALGAEPKSDVGFTYLNDMRPNMGIFRLSDVRPRPEKADRGGGCIINFPKERYPDWPHTAAGLQSFDFNHTSKIKDGQAVVHFDMWTSLRHASDGNGWTFRPVLRAWNSSEQTQLIYDATIMWMEKKRDAKSCRFNDVPIQVKAGKGQEQVTFSMPWEEGTEFEVYAWASDFNFRGGDAAREGFAVSAYASDITVKGFTANVKGSSNLDKCEYVWIAVRKDKQGSASGSFGIADVKNRKGFASQNSGRIDFPRGKFRKAPNVIAALSSFDLAGGRDLRVGVEVKDVSKTGFTWHLNTWGDNSDDALRSATATYFALGYD